MIDVSSSLISKKAPPQEEWDAFIAEIGLMDRDPEYRQKKNNFAASSINTLAQNTAIPTVQTSMTGLLSATTALTSKQSSVVFNAALTNSLCASFVLYKFNHRNGNGKPISLTIL